MEGNAVMQNSEMSDQEVLDVLEEYREFFDYERLMLMLGLPARARE